MLSSASTATEVRATSSGKPPSSHTWKWSRQRGACSFWGLTAHVLECEMLHLAVQLCSLPSHGSAGWQQALLQEVASASPIPALQYLHGLKISVWNTLKCFHHGKREELAPGPLGNRNHFCQRCCHWRALLPAAHSNKPSLLCSLSGWTFPNHPLRKPESKPGNNLNMIHVCNSAF